MGLLGKALSMGVIGLVALALLLALSATFWGWVFMLIAGACGLHWGFWPVCWLVGLGASFILG